MNKDFVDVCCNDAVKSLTLLSIALTSAPSDSAEPSDVALSVSQCALHQAVQPDPETQLCYLQQRKALHQAFKHCETDRCGLPDEALCLPESAKEVFVGIGLPSEGMHTCRNTSSFEN